MVTMSDQSKVDYYIFKGITTCVIYIGIINILNIWCGGPGGSIILTSNTGMYVYIRLKTFSIGVIKFLI